MKKLHLFFLIIFVCGCSKDKFSPAELKLTFTGKVLDYTTGQPVGNAMVKLALLDEISYDRWPTFIYTTTDEQGNYLFTVTPDKQTSYDIIPLKTGFVFADTSIHWLRNITETTSYFDTLLLDVASILQINYHDNNVSSNNDTLDLMVGFGSDSLNINAVWDHHAYINYNTSFQFFDSASYRQNCFARIVSIINNSLFQVKDTTVRLNEFGTKSIDLYY